MGVAEGSKKLVRDLINLWKIKKGVHPALILKKLTDIWNVLEDVYSVESADEFQSAIDAISNGAGTIFIEAGTHIIDTTIDIDGGGSYVIYGHGDNSILQPTDGTTVFNITNAESVIIQLLKFDLNNYTANTKGILVNETNNNVVFVENVTIDGNGTNGIGIEIQSNNSIIHYCRITDMNYGINIDGNSNIITNNTINTNTIGVRLTVDSNINYVYENINGNTVQWSDNGTNNNIEYICYTAQDIQDAIDSIAAKSGTIHIVSDTIAVSGTIDIDGGGIYTIRGEGESTILTMDGDNTVFDITSCTACLFSNFKITSAISAAEAGIVIDIAQDNVIIEQLIIMGNGSAKYGIGINIQNTIENVTIRECKLSWFWRSIKVFGTNCFVIDNIIEHIAFGINIDGRGNLISRNFISEIAPAPPQEGNFYGIRLDTGGAASINNTIDGNTIHSSTQGSGIFVNGADISSPNIISGNTVYDCSAYGIEVWNGRELSITANHLYSNGQAGLRGNDIRFVLISSNICNNNGGEAFDVGGFYLQAGQYNLVIGNYAYGNTDEGFHCSGGFADSIFVGNMSHNNVLPDDYNLPNNTFFGDDTAYGAGWNGDKGTPTKDAVYDILKSITDRLDAHGI